MAMKSASVCRGVSCGRPLGLGMGPRRHATTRPYNRQPKDYPICGAMAVFTDFDVPLAAAAIASAARCNG